MDGTLKKARKSTKNHVTFSTVGSRPEIVLLSIIGCAGRRDKKGNERAQHHTCELEILPNKETFRRRFHGKESSPLEAIRELG